MAQVLSEPRAGEFLRHARQLLSLTSAPQLLAQTCHELRRVTGARCALGSWSTSGQAWERGTRVQVPGTEPGSPLPRPVVSALFALHRKAAAAREALSVARTSETEAIFAAVDAGLISVGGGGGETQTLWVLPITGRIGRLMGEFVVALGQAEVTLAGQQRLLEELVQLSAVALDSAHRHAIARRDQDRLHLIAEASGEALWDWQLDSGELWWGGGIQKLLGQGAQGVEYRWAWKLDRIHPDDRDVVVASFEASRVSSGAAPWRAEYRFRRADGSWLVVEDCAYFLREVDGRAWRAVGSLRDVTPLKQLLAREQAARTVAETASRAKDEFLAMLGHELRNPLAPILGAVELMRARGVPAVERERAIIERQAQHMVRLVEDLLDVSRVAAGKSVLHKRRIELAEAVARSIEMAGGLIDERRHRLEVAVAHSGLCVEVDPARLSQILCNLLSNAARYTDPGGRIQLSARCDAEHVTIEVSDSGVGISEAMLPRIFDLFVQERQSIDRAQGGLGLGLAIVRSLVELHGGTVEAFSEGPGRGSRFTVRLPAAPPVEHHSAPGVATVAMRPAQSPGLRILVVDDNRDAAEMLGEILRDFAGAHHTTHVVHDGLAAMEAAVTFEPDMVLLDVGLPRLNGYEVARRLREREAQQPLTARRLLLVAITGYGQESDRQQAREAGFDAHLVKPVDLVRLEETIRELGRTVRRG